MRLGYLIGGALVATMALAVVATRHAPKVKLDRIRAFEQSGVPVDAYGIGSSLIRGENDFTGDIVLTDGRPTAKVGRSFRPNPRLELVS